MFKTENDTKLFPQGEKSEKIILFLLLFQLKCLVQIFEKPFVVKYITFLDNFKLKATRIKKKIICLKDCENMLKVIKKKFFDELFCYIKIKRIIKHLFKNK